MRPSQLRIRRLPLWFLFMLVYSVSQSGSLSITNFVEYSEVGRLDTSFSLLFDVGRLNFDVKDITRSPNRRAFSFFSAVLGRKALPAVSGGPVLQLLPPGHADGPSSASPGKVVVGQLKKVVQHGVDGVVRNISL